MTGPAPPPAPPEFLQLQNAVVTANLLDQLGITSPVRFNVLPTVIPVAVLSTEDPTATDKLAFGTSDLAGVAAQLTKCQLFNPANSGVILHVDSAIVSVETASQVDVRIFDVALTTNLSNKGFRDRRLSGTPVAQTRVVSAAGSLGSARLKLDLEAGVSELVPLDMFLGVGQGVHFETIANQDLIVSFFWEEIAARG